MAETLPHVIVLGAGFGGIEAVKSMRRAPVDVTIIDRENHHCFQPLLYQVATATLSPADIAWPVRHILRGQRNATVLMAEATGIDLKARRVLLRGTNPIGYDCLIVATGATHSYFGHDNWAQFAPGLKQIVDATRIRRSVLMAFEQAELPDNEAMRQRLLTFVIVGGGATGVEMAGAIAEIARHTLARDFRNIDPRTARIVLVEAGPRILPALAENLANYAARTLTRMGVEIRTSTRVTNCDANGVDLAAGRLDAGTVIWAAGVKASPAAQWLGAESDRAGRVVVCPDLSLPGHNEVFVIGDAAAVHDKVGGMAPGIAPAAKQMGRYVGKLIQARLAGRALPPFHYRHAGDLATIGRRAAVVQLGRLHLTGFAGWLFWSVAHIYFLIGLRHRFVVAFMWLWDFITFQRGALLITDVPPSGRPERPLG
jgi:NADH dehydrogenase